MKNKNEVRVCKNKRCQKLLPIGYKHKYCEACRNKQIQRMRDISKIGGIALTGVAVLVFTGGKTNFKK